MFVIAGKLGENPVYGCPKKNQKSKKKFLSLEATQTTNNQN
jgi:hypothetical protein